MYKTHKIEITQLVVTLPCEHVQLTQTMMKSMTKVSSGYMHNKSYKRNNHMHLGSSPDQLAVGPCYTYARIHIHKNMPSDKFYHSKYTKYNMFMRSHGNEIILIIRTQLSSKQVYTVVIIETTVKIFQLPFPAIYMYLMLDINTLPEILESESLL